MNEGDRRRRIGLTKKLAREQEELARLEAQLAALVPREAMIGVAALQALAGEGA